jgi:hypothetical protein
MASKKILRERIHELTARNMTLAAGDGMGPVARSLAVGDGLGSLAGGDGIPLNPATREAHLVPAPKECRLRISTLTGRRNAIEVVGLLSAIDMSITGRSDRSITVKFRGDPVINEAAFKEVFG